MLFFDERTSEGERERVNLRVECVISMIEFA